MPKPLPYEHLAVSAPPDESAYSSSSNAVVSLPLAGFANITSRERQVIECLCADMTVKLTAHHLRLSEFTVQDHIKNIKRKLEVHTVNGLVARALRERIL